MSANSLLRRRPMNVFGRLVFVLFAALLLLAQHEAAVHAIGHLPELLAGPQQSDHDDESAPHKCPDCARFALVSVGGPPPDAPMLQAAQGLEPVVRPVVAALTNPPLARPRNRSPPQS